MPKQTYSIELEERQYKFLEQMVQQYGLRDASKAVRIMCDYVIQETDQQQTVFAEIRCQDC